MTDIATLRALLERVREASGPDRELDAEIANAFGLPQAFFAELSIPFEEVDGPSYYITPATWGGSGYSWHAPTFTGSLDAALALVSRVLPGWIWKVCSCSVSDDAWLCPDFNHPVHGRQLRAELEPFEAGSIWDDGIDIDRRPPGNPALALIEALLEAKIALLSRAEAERAEAEKGDAERFVAEREASIGKGARRAERRFRPAPDAQGGER